MPNPKVSVIIPAANEEKCLKETLDSLGSQTYPDIEIIVSVNGSKDRTLEIAQKYTQKALNFPSPLTPSKARNEGAKIAAGEILLFLDADTQLSANAIEKIVEITARFPAAAGTCLAKIKEKNFRSKLLFGIKNLIHRLNLYKGFTDGVLFCKKDLFLKVKGFDPEKKVAEFHDFMLRARNFGVLYKFLANCYVVTSARRFEKQGYLKTILFWLKWKIGSLITKKDKIAKEYKDIR